MNSRPIRWAAWILVLVTLSVALVLAGRYGNAYAVFIVPPWRIELSLLLFAFLCTLVFSFAYGSVRLAERAWHLRRTLAARKIERRHNRTQRALFQGWRDFFAGRFRAAEQGGQRATDSDTREVRDQGCLLAAWAAHESGAADRAAAYLRRIGDPRALAMREASQARMLLAAGRGKEALALLEPLTDAASEGLIKWKMQAAMAEGQWETVLGSLPALLRAGLMEQETLRGIRLYAESHILASLPADRDTILVWWKALARASRYDPAIAATVARRLSALDAGEDARRVIEDTVDSLGALQWDSSLAAAYADCVCESTLTQIERAENWLQAEPRDPVLLASLGKLCMRQSLWGKAQSYLEAAIALSPSVDAHLTLAKLMEQIGKPDEAAQHIRRAAEIAQ
ncbi:MAG: hypothetical protein HY255_01420 [Betaproteobacteria bacterium]|nr:hypothetical protein [Betaproteobacteria bacterium]